jgi:DNA (cytosine-5)-methyltransferase 1
MSKKYIYLEKNTFAPIIDTQRTEFFESLQLAERNGIYKIAFDDKNYNCMPYLDSVLDSGTQGLSFFSGGGGLDIGAQMAGIKVLTSLDFEKDAIATLKANKFFAHTEHRLDDIRNVKASDFAEILRRNNPEKLVLLGGPPCQPFSKAGYWKTLSQRLGPDDPRNMIGSYLGIIDEIKPDGFILENVESILHPHNRQAVEDLANALEQMNYNYVLVKANACDFGVPQKRKRVFFIASKKKINGMPIATHSEKPEQGKLSYERVVDWIGRFDNSEANNEILSTEGLHHGSLIQVPPGSNYIALSEKRGHVPGLFKAGTRYWTFLLKLHPYMPSWTIIAQPGHWEGPFHWNNRRLNNSELAAIQTFPLDYKFVGSPRSVHKQIGNAVPCLLAKAMCNFLKGIV